MAQASFKISGNIVDVWKKSIYHACLEIVDGKIQSIQQTGEPVQAGNYILPGFVDAHVHVESSMLIPSVNLPGWLLYMER